MQRKVQLFMFQIEHKVANLKKLLVPLIGQYDPEDPASLERPAIRAALEIARRLTAHVDAVTLLDPPAKRRSGWPFWLPGGGTAELCELIDKASEARRTHAAATFEAALNKTPEPPIRVKTAAPGYSVRYSEVIGEISEVVGPLGRVADLSVLSSPDTNWTEPYTPLVHACLTQTGRPVLIVPKSFSSIGKKIAIAWDGSEAAARALSVSMPLLDLAESIIVVTAQERNKPNTDPEAVIEYLAWHGLSARAQILPARAMRPENRILDVTCELGSDLLLIGNRIHSRMHQAVFGSMTEKVLDKPRIAALIG